MKTVPILTLSMFKSVFVIPWKGLLTVDCQCTYKGC